jgi:hydroxypyruvate reductase
MSAARKHALQIFRAALDAADPVRAVLAHVQFDGRVLRVERRRYTLAQFENIYVLGAGKAGAAMARAVETLLDRRITAGAINVPDGATARLRRITAHASGHPVPDRRGVEGARRILDLARAAGPRDLVICLISGGASALLPAPVEGLTLAAKQEITRKLLESGATIHELNTVRKHLSHVKGGRLAQLAHPARTVALILSDVIGDDLDVIGSGPTVGDRSTIADARAVLSRYGIELRGDLLEETPKPGDAALRAVQNVIVGSNRQAIAAAAKKARALGYRTVVLSTTVEGETREIAAMHAAIAREVLLSGQPVKRPACILSGGETTVTVRGSGLGGRNQEFVLAATIALNRAPVTIFSAGTDGIDGPTDAAGALADATTLARAAEQNLDPRRCLDNNDSYHFFEPLNSLVKTGPTGTNVMDIRVLLVP